MSGQPALSFLSHFAALNDPRQAAKVLYPLPEILLLLLCATIAGADDCVEIALWGEEHMAFLRRFLPFRWGIPSHDVLCDVIAAIDPVAFKTCFEAWVETLRAKDPAIIAVDGKTSRRSHDRRKGRMALHTVSAWATPGPTDWRWERSGTVEPYGMARPPMEKSTTSRASWWDGKV